APGARPGTGRRPAAGVPLGRVELGPLEPASVEALVCDALRIEPQAGQPLAAAILGKTAGNPFFIRRFLQHLYRERLLTYDETTGRWSWDLPRIQFTDITENVVDLLSRNIRSLPAAEQRMLGTAACVGNEFSVGLLAGVLDMPLDQVSSTLWGPVEEGLLVPQKSGPRFPWAGGRPVELGGAAPTYRFVHDRVQEA